MKRYVLALLLGSLWVSNVWADVALFVWQPTPQHPRYLLPQKAGETPRQAIEAYRALLFSRSEITELADGSLFRNGEGQTPELERGQDKVLFVANNKNDLRPNDFRNEVTRVQRLMNQFPRSANYVLPLGATERLRPEQRQEFHRRISNEFSGLILMGGDDVTPAMYRERVDGAVNFNSTRDKLEIELIQSFVKAEKGFVFGICRGHQITSVALGYKLHQHIPRLENETTKHRDNNHLVHQRKTTNGLLRDFVGTANPFTVYSWHHQAVIFHEGGPLELAATSKDGLTEALEFLNKKGMLVQYHPELHSTPAARTFIESIWSKGMRPLVRQFNCRRVMM